MFLFNVVKCMVPNPNDDAILLLSPMNEQVTITEEYPTLRYNILSFATGRTKWKQRQRVCGDKRVSVRNLVAQLAEAMWLFFLPLRSAYSCWAGTTTLRWTTFGNTMPRSNVGSR